MKFIGGGMMFRKFAAVVCVLLAISAAPAWAAKTATYEGRFAAKYPAIAQAGTVGVITFNGRDGDEFAATLTAALQSAEIDGRPVLSVKTIEGMNYKSTGELSGAEVARAIQLGKKLGVNVIFTGTITAATFQTSNFTKSESVCIKSSGFLKCEQSEQRQIPCTKISAQYAATPRAILVSSGSLVYSEAINIEDGYTSCNGQVQAESMGQALASLGSFFSSAKKGPPEAVPADQLMIRLRQKVASQVRERIAPYNKTVTVTLRDDVKGLPKPTQIKLKNALDFAQAGRMDRACSILETLMDDTTANNVTLLYNLGVCQEVLLPDAPSAALEYYAKADQLLDKPDKLVSDAYLRTKSMVSSERAISRSLAPGNRTGAMPSAVTPPPPVKKK